MLQALLSFNLEIRIRSSLQALLSFVGIDRPSRDPTHSSLQAKRGTFTEPEQRQLIVGRPHCSDCYGSAVPRASVPAWSSNEEQG